MLFERGLLFSSWKPEDSTNYGDLSERDAAVVGGDETVRIDFESGVREALKARIQEQRILETSA